MRSKKKQTPRHNGPCEIRSSSKKTVSYSCGHDGPRQASAVFWGEERPIKEDRDPAKSNCPQCLLMETLRVSIRCCLCGCIIMPGDGVAIYDPKCNPKLGHPAWATATPDGQLVGCLSMDCCPSGAFFAGQWTEAGFHPAFEGGNIAQEALRTGQPVVVRDTSPR
ncbi:MAG: hypothetical protein Q7S48_03825 [bacterium]|nr:hypothetical protein [bacterium]